MISDSQSLPKYKYNCLVCNKQYTRKCSLDKHKILCDFKIKSQRERNIETEELGDLPNQLELIKIVQQLSIKLSKMEEKMEVLQKWIDKKKKKINVILWLNSNINPSIGFKEWATTQIVVTNEHFENLMENTLYHTIQKIFEQNLSENNDFIYPIKCFSQKAGIFYVCDKKENNLPEWRLMIQTDINLLLKNIQNRMIHEISIWKMSNQLKFNDNGKIAELFNKAIIKLMSISYSQDGTSSRIKNGLYNYLKSDLKLFMDFEFEF
jgi:hypothetical protein